MPQRSPSRKPLPRDPNLLPFVQPSDVQTDITLDSLSLPDSLLIRQAKQFLQPQLGEQIWNVSMMARAQQPMLTLTCSSVLL